MKASRTKFYISLFLLIVLTGIFTLNSCSSGSTESESESDTEVIESTESESESQSETESEIDSSADTGENTYSAPSYASPEPTESASESESESETETEAVILPVDKLEYLSNGNGTCTLVGIGECTDVCIIIPIKSPDGDVVTSIGEKAFFGCDFISAVQIPSTVTSIGNLAFADCKSLAYISVDEGNTAFSDELGVLFSLDGKALLQYPGASSAPTFELPISVERIADMAFYRCSALKLINYAGGIDDWAQIEIGDMNFGLFSASVSYKE